ncbi:MAG: leucine-rich repeat domain-containing protein [Candidatus Hermodarchaeota archaeon]
MSDDKRIDKNERKILEEIESVCGVPFKRVNMQSYSTVENLFNFNEEGLVITIGFDFTKLDLDDTKLDLLGDSVSKLKNIERLLIKLPEYSIIPEWFKNLSYVKELVFSNSFLKSIPDVIMEFKNLNKLILKGNRIRILPEWLLTLNELKEFTLNDQVQTLDSTPSNMEILKALNEKNVKISDPTFTLHFKLKIPLNQIDIIRKISWSEHGLKRVFVQKLDSINESWRDPGGFGVKLRVFNGNIMQIGINDTDLEMLPKDFGNLKELNFLFLPNNKIVSLPDTIGKLKKLKGLILSSNKLTSLPESFINLTALQYLDMSNNEFKEIPTQIWALKELTKLSLSGNPLSSEENTIIQKVPDLIREYLRKKATIRVFISHAVADFEPYRIGDLVEYLEKQKEISEVYFCEEDLAGNIDEWMLDAVQKCQLLLFIATNKSVFNSVDCANELQLADKFSIPVIPIKGYDVDWSDLAEKNLSRELGLEFNEENFDLFSEELYKYIENFKREIDLMDKTAREKGIIDIYERFRLILDDIVRDLKRNISNLSEKVEGLADRITNLEKRL